MTTKKRTLYSDLAIPPGETLAEELEARGMTQKELASHLGRPAQVINEIIKGKKAITPETALGLEAVLGISAQFWVNLEAKYRLTLARNSRRDLAIADSASDGALRPQGMRQALTLAEESASYAEDTDD